jgi:hypothetical protein
MVLSRPAIAIFRAATRCTGIGSTAILRNHLNQDICKNEESPYSSQETHGEMNNSSLGYEGLRNSWSHCKGLFGCFILLLPT